MDKVFALIAYMADRMEQPFLKSILKLLYFTDEKSVVSNGYPLTWLKYFAWEKGPVCKTVYEYKNSMPENKFVEIERNEDGKVLLKSKSSFEEQKQEFSDCELELINAIIDEYGQMSFEKMSKKTHEKGSLWSKCVEKNNIDFSKNPKTSYKLDFKNLIKGNEELCCVYEDAKDCATIKGLL